MQQTFDELFKCTRYLMKKAIVLSNEFMTKNIPKELLDKVDLRGAYIIRLSKPIPCLMFAFGASGSFMPDIPSLKYTVIDKSFAEDECFGRMFDTIDPDNKYKLKAGYYHIDLKDADAKFVRIPSDEEIADLHVRYKNLHRPPTTTKQMLQRKKPVTEDAKLESELRILDKRRFVDANLVPPPHRIGNLKKIQQALAKVSGTIISSSVFDDDVEEAEIDEAFASSHDVLFGIMEKMTRDKQAYAKKEEDEEDEAPAKIELADDAIVVDVKEFGEDDSDSPIKKKTSEAASGDLGLEENKKEKKKRGRKKKRMIEEGDGGVGALATGMEIPSLSSKMTKTLEPPLKKKRGRKCLPKDEKSQKPKTLAAVLRSMKARRRSVCQPQSQFADPYETLGVGGGGRDDD